MFTPPCPKIVLAEAVFDVGAAVPGVVTGEVVEDAALSLVTRGDVTAEGED